MHNARGGSSTPTTTTTTKVVYIKPVTPIVPHYNSYKAQYYN